MDLAGLPADTWVAYQFHDDVGGSVPGRFVTPQAADATGVVRLGICSCLAQDHRAFPALTNTEGRGPLDAFLFLGDTAYFDSRDTRQEFRDLYALNLTAPGFSDLLPRTACIYTWDDHEFSNNFDPTTISPERFDLALSSWLEHLPVREHPDERRRIWRSFRFGATAEVFVLDCRSERDRSDDRYLSEAQLKWLIDGVTSSTATWKIIANSVPMISFENPAWDIPLALDDRWESFDAQRQRVVDAFSQLDGVLFVSGDVHCAILGRIDVEGPGRRIWDLVCGPGGSFLNISAGFLVSEQIPFAAAVHNAVRLELEHDGTARIEVVGEEDQTWGSFTLGADGVLRAYTWTDPVTGDVSSG